MRLYFILDCYVGLCSIEQLRIHFNNLFFFVHTLTSPTYKYVRIYVFPQKQKQYTILLRMFWSVGRCVLHCLQPSQLKSILKAQIVHSTPFHHSPWYSFVFIKCQGDFCCKSTFYKMY